MSGRLIIVAQGSTAAARGGLFADDGVDEKGRVAVVAARSRMPRSDESLVSPATASRETATLLDLSFNVDETLKDLDVGEWQGQSLQEIAGRDPAGASAFVADRDFRGHGGESLTDLIVRAGAWLDQRRAIDKTTMVIAPATLVRALVVAALDVSAQTFWRIDVAPLCVVTLGTNGRRWTLRGLEPG